MDLFNGVAWKNTLVCFFVFYLLFARACSFLCTFEVIYLWLIFSHFIECAFSSVCAFVRCTHTCSFKSVCVRVCLLSICVRASFVCMCPVCAFASACYLVGSRFLMRETQKGYSHCTLPY